MDNQSSKKHKTQKEAHAKTPKKRGRKLAMAISRPPLPSVRISILIIFVNFFVTCNDFSVLSEKIFLYFLDYLSDTENTIFLYIFFIKYD